MSPASTPAAGTNTAGQPSAPCSVADYLTPEQAAELLQVSVKTLLKWARQDPSMPVLRLGRVVRFPRERFMAWLKRQEQRAVRRTA